MSTPQALKAVLRLDSSVAAAFVIFIMALPLEASALRSAFLRPRGVLIALAVNIALLPVIAWGAGFLLSPPMAQGLAIAAAIPSTLASSSVLTRRAGGNEAVSILVMMISNLLCFAYTPVLLRIFAGGSGADEPDSSLASMMKHLTMIVVAPVVFAQLLRSIAWVRHRTKTHKKALSIVAQLGLLSVVFKGAVATGLQLRDDRMNVSAVAIAAMTVIVCVVHLLALLASYFGARLIGGSREESIGAGFSGSQKTLMVGLELCSQYYPNALILPIVAYHCCQLIVDTMIADWWGEHTTRLAPPA